jgi:hypothetical protein
LDGSWLRAYIPKQNIDYQQGRYTSEGHGSGSTRRYDFNTQGRKSGSESDSWRRSDSIRSVEGNTSKDIVASGLLQENDKVQMHGFVQTMKGIDKQLPLTHEDKEMGERSELTLPTVQDETPITDSRVVDRPGAMQDERHDDHKNSHACSLVSVQDKENTVCAPGKEKKDYVQETQK